MVKHQRVATSASLLGKPPPQRQDDTSYRNLRFHASCVKLLELAPAARSAFSNWTRVGGRKNK